MLDSSDEAFQWFTDAHLTKADDPLQWVLRLHIAVSNAEPPSVVSSDVTSLLMPMHRLQHLKLLHAVSSSELRVLSSIPRESLTHLEVGLGINIPLKIAMHLISLVPSIRSLKLHIFSLVSIIRQDMPTPVLSNVLELAWIMPLQEFILAGIVELESGRFPKLEKFTLRVPQLRPEECLSLHSFFMNHPHIQTLDLDGNMDAIHDLLELHSVTPKNLTLRGPLKPTIEHCLRTVQRVDIVNLQPQENGHRVWDLLNEVSAIHSRLPLREVWVHALRWQDGRMTSSAAAFIGQLLSFAFALERVGITIRDCEGHTFREAPSA